MESRAKLGAPIRAGRSQRHADASEELMPVVYDELRRLAGAHSGTRTWQESLPEQPARLGYVRRVLDALIRS